MFPKAHAAAYVMMAWRIAWYKVYHPLAYYAAYFSIRAKAFSYEDMCLGKERLDEKMSIIKNTPKHEVKNAELDLVKIAPGAKPPVCKIINYGKYRYEQARREKEAKKKQKTIDVKEIRLSPNIDTNDLNTKSNQARKFLSKGDKVKVTLRFRGREMAHKDVGREVLNAFFEKLEDVAVIDKDPKMEGRSMIMFLTAAK